MPRTVAVADTRGRRRDLQKSGGRTVRVCGRPRQMPRPRSTLNPSPDAKETPRGQDVQLSVTRLGSGWSSG